MHALDDNGAGKSPNPLFVFAGYAKEIVNFLKSNVGLPRRINQFNFKDYTPKELGGDILW